MVRRCVYANFIDPQTLHNRLSLETKIKRKGLINTHKALIKLHNKRTCKLQNVLTRSTTTYQSESRRIYKILHRNDARRFAGFFYKRQNFRTFVL